MLHRVSSYLSPETEDILTKCIEAALEVHTRLGGGYVEAVYHKAMCIELRHRAIPFETEHTVQIKYRDEVIHAHRIDLVVNQRVVLELKSVDRLHPIHQGQLASCLRAWGLKAGLLMNFNTDHLRGNIRRIVV